MKDPYHRRSTRLRHTVLRVSKQSHCIRSVPTSLLNEDHHGLNVNLPLNFRSNCDRSWSKHVFMSPLFWRGAPQRDSCVAASGFSSTGGNKSVQLSQTREHSHHDPEADEQSLHLGEACCFDEVGGWASLKVRRFGFIGTRKSSVSSVGCQEVFHGPAAIRSINGRSKYT